AIRVVLAEEREGGAPQQGEVGDDVGLATAGAVFAAKGIAAPVVADFDAGPMAADEVMPAGVRALASLLAGKIVPGLEAVFAALLLRAAALHRDDGASKGKANRGRLDRPQDQPAFFDPTVAA